MITINRRLTHQLSCAAPVTHPKTTWRFTQIHTHTRSTNKAQGQQRPTIITERGKKRQ